MVSMREELLRGFFGFRKRDVVPSIGAHRAQTLIGPHHPVIFCSHFEFHSLRLGVRFSENVLLA
jgi:hypothetical protein